MFFGPVSGLISTIISLIFRNYLGGGGALTGTLVITASFIIGFYFYYRKTKNKFNLSKINLYLFGVLTSAAMMVLMLSLPSSSILSAYKTITLTVMISYPIISLVIGKILLDQEENRYSIEKIKQEESLFRTTLYSIGDAVITTDKNGNVQHMNPIAEKLTGWNEENAKGKILIDVFKIINEETRLDVENPVVRVLKEKTIVGLANHTLLISKNGNEIPIADSGAPIINENDEIIGVVLVFRDQTEDYANQKRLIENEIRFRSIVEGAPDAIFVQTDHNFTYLNSKACNIFGCKSRDELIGKKVIERFHPADREKVAERIHQLNDNKHEVPVREETIVRMDGSFVTAEFSAMPITYEGKDGALVFFRDITERKKTESIIEESEKKYRYLFEQNPHPMIVYAIENWQILDVNSTAVAKYGYSRDEFLNMTVFDLRRQSEKEQFVHIVNREIPDSQITGPWKHLLKNGSEIIVEVFSHVIFYQNKKARMIVINDITEKVKAENALRQSEERWQFALEGPGDGIWDWNVKTNEVYFSHQWKAMLGYEDIDIKNSIDEWKRIVHADDLKNAMDDLEKHFKGETPFYRNEQRLLCKDGTYKWILNRGKVMNWDDDGSPLRVIGTHTDISEKKKSEETLRQSEEKMRLIIEGTSFFFFYTQNINGDITYISPTVEKITGYNVEEWMNQRHWFTTENPINEEARRRTQRHFIGEMIYEPLIMEVQHKKGSSILLEIFETPFLKDGKVIGLQGIARDITANKQAEEALRLSEEKLQSIFRAAPIGIGVVVNRVLIEVNPRFCEMIGYAKEELIGKSSRLLYLTDEEYESVGSAKYKQIAMNGTGVVETQFITKYGKVLDILLASTPIEINDLSKGVTFTSLDISERKRAEIALKESEEKFRIIFENHSAIKLLINAETGDIHDANYAAALYYGWSREELKQMNIKQINTLTTNEVETEMKKALDEKRIHFEFRHKLADNSIHDVEVFTSKIEIAGKNYLHSIVQDITKKKQTEELLKMHRENLEELVKLRTNELNEANIKLHIEIEKEKEYEMLLKQALEKEKEINEIKSKFISTTSHEFRTPLTSILSSFELLQRYGKNWSEEKYNYHASKIKNSIEYLTNLLDDILTISRSESGKIIFDPVNLNLKRMCLELIEESKIHSNMNHRINYEFNSDQDEFLLDPKLIRFILTNLLTNAFKYSPDGGDVILKVEYGNGKIILNVSDQGIGIPKDELQYLFEPFHRAKNTTEIHGTGLGLSIVKRSVQIHQGDIKVDSKLGEGTSFTVILPINKGSK